MADKVEKISLDSVPKDYAYEDYIAALLLYRGDFYLERSIKKKTSGIGDEFEWDIVTNRYSEGTSPEKRFVEIKSKSWGADDIFKVRGWMTYMNYEHSIFIVQQIKEKSFTPLQEIANKLDICLIANQPTKEGKLDDQQIIKTLNLREQELSPGVFEAVRFSLHLERMMIDFINKRKKNTGKDQFSCSKISEYWNELNNAPFFVQDPDERISRIFHLYVEYKNITARVDHELNGEGWLDSDKCQSLVDGHYIKLYYETLEISPIHIAAHVELLNRLSILKACVDELKTPRDEQESWFQKMMKDSEHIKLPNNIKDGIKTLSEEKYFYLYPRFWQIFIYGFGGFILLDKKDLELKLLSYLTAIPLNEIDNAFNSMDKLFPTEKGWLRVYSKTNIRVLAMMPPQFIGIGANMRRIIYRDGDKEELSTFDVLGKKVTGERTLDNLVHWNNLAYAYLKEDATLIKSTQTVVS